MKNTAIILLVFAIFSMGIQTALAAQSEEVKVRSLGEVKIVEYVNNTDTTTHPGEKKLSPLNQTNMHPDLTTLPVEKEIKASEKTDELNSQPDYAPYIIVLFLGIVALFLYWSRKR
jgi:hypothetical protein